MNRYSEAQATALADLAREWADHSFTLIGASALSHHLGLRWRQTEDLDLTVAIDLENLDRATARLGGWKRHARFEHQWQSPRGVKVDIVPAGAAPSAQKTLIWPQSGFVMSLVGLDLALAHFVRVELARGVEIRVATVPVLLVLKMTAWLDRGFERRRDLADIAYMFEEFLDAGDERRYEDHVLAASISYEDVSAYVLGREVARIADSSHRAVVERFLATVSDVGSAEYATMVRDGPPSLRGDEEHGDDEPLVRRIEAFRRGFTET